MKNLLAVLALTLLIFGLNETAAAQNAPAVSVPRPSSRGEVAQMIGDTSVRIVYHRPMVKGRKIWGELVPYGEVWRMGANENTTFEVSENVKINGQNLPAGKYGLHAIPTTGEWTIAFNKVNNEWGSFKYDAKQDQLRVKAKPQMNGAMQEAMQFVVNPMTLTTGEMILSWEKLRLAVTIDAGDVQGRTLSKLRQNIADSNAGDGKTQVGARMMAANYVLGEKIKASYDEAGTWINDALKMSENFDTLRAKARISAASGSYADAVSYGEKAVTAGKAMGDKINAEFFANFQKELATWKQNK